MHVPPGRRLHSRHLHARRTAGARQAAFATGQAAPRPWDLRELEYAVPDKATAQAIVRMVSERFGAPSAGESDDDHLWNPAPL